MAIARLRSFLPGRLRRLRSKMLESELDCLIVIDPSDVRYLTGFTGEDSVLVVTGRHKIMVTDSRYVEQIRQESPWLSVRNCKGSGRLIDMVCETAFDVLASLKKYQPRRNREQTIGIDQDAVTVRQYKAYRKISKKGFKLRPSPPLLRQLRQCKDDFELSRIRKSIKVAQYSMREVLGWLEVGMSEQEVAGRLEYDMARRGGAPAAFKSIVAFGAHAAQPHAIPGLKRLRRGQPLLFDWGATVGGYKSDLTRCYVAGKIPPTFASAYQWLLETQVAAIQAVRAGTTLKEVDAAARKVPPRKLPVYEHGTGHGIGLDIHERPFITAAGNEPLQEGMVITIEPGIYVPGRFGIRIEDDVLVTSGGRKVLTSLAKDLNSVSLLE
jgi:Xaa-Pro aminopeptidase